MKILLSSLAVLAMLHVVISIPYPGVSMQTLLDKLEKVEQQGPQGTDYEDYGTENANAAALVNLLQQQQQDDYDIANEEKFSFGNLLKVGRKGLDLARKGVSTYHSLVGACVAEQDDQTYPFTPDQMEPQETVDALLKQLQQQMAREQLQEDDDTAEGERFRFKSFWGKAKNYGRKGLSLARTGFRAYNHLKGRCETQQPELQEALETLAQLQQGPSQDIMDEEPTAQVQQDMEAAMEGFWSKVKNWGRKAYNGVKKGCRYIPLKNQNMAEIEFLGTAFTLLKGACNHIRGNQVTTEGLFGFSLDDLKRKGKQLLGYARTGCKKYGEHSSTVKTFLGGKTKYLDLICGGLNGSQPAVVQLLLNNAIRSVVEDKEQTDMEQSMGEDLIRSFAN